MLLGYSREACRFLATKPERSAAQGGRDSNTAGSPCGFVMLSGYIREACRCLASLSHWNPWQVVFILSLA